MHLGSSPSSSSSLVQVRTVTRRTTASGNSDNSRGRYLKNNRHVNCFLLSSDISVWDSGYSDKTKFVCF